MRNIKNIVVHCSATHPLASVESIQRYWREVMKWKSPGYHIIIKADGTEQRLAPDTAVTNGVGGHNSTSLHVCYIGGVVPARESGKQVPSDTRTDAQKEALLRILCNWKGQFPDAVILGHRDFPGVSKACPSFDAKAEYSTL